MNRINTLLLVVLFMSAGMLGAQVFTAEEAVALALKNNYQVQVARNEADAAAVIATYGNAGMLPRLDITANGQLQSSNIDQKFSSGLVVQRNGVGSNSAVSQLGMTWTLFDGSRMFYAYNRLKEQEAGGKLALRQQMELTIDQVLTSYYTIVRLKQELTALEFGLKISEEQVKITGSQVEVGSGARQLLLLAMTTRNGWKSQVLQQKLTLQNAELELNRLLARDLFTAFSVSDSIPVQFNATLPELTKTAVDENASVLLLKNNESVLGYQVKELKAGRLPRLALNAAYGLSRSSSEGGFALYNFSQGPGVGLQLNWNLFNGGILKTQVKQADLFRQNASLLTQNGQLQVSSEVIQAYRTWESATELRELEEDNFQLAKENATILAERFRLGLDNILLVNEAQRTFQESISRVTAARFSAKKAEITLMRLSGALLK